jgi:hypothetical protein
MMFQIHRHIERERVGVHINNQGSLQDRIREAWAVSHKLAD